MILLHSFTHRYQLAEILGRWLVHDLQPADGPIIKEILNFNGLITRNCVEEVAGRMFAGLLGQPIRTTRITNKGELKHFMAYSTPTNTSRAEELIRNFSRNPDLFYLETPFDGNIFWTGEPGGNKHYLGSTRLKSIRRIGEKGSRRIIDHIFEQIKQKADMLAEERARRLGIPLNLLVTPAEDMSREFLRAEAQVKDSIKRGFLLPPGTHFNIHDVAGIKVAGNQELLNKALDWLDKDPRCQVLEVEVHTGNYNATNVRVEYKFDKARFLDVQFGAGLKNTLATRGLNPASVEERFKQFVEESEDTINLEVILSTEEETLESEFGRCMHEERVIRQRARQEYRSALASNVSRLTEWAFAFALSNQRDVQEIPIKLWVSYMPEYYDMVFRTLYNIPYSTAIETP